MIKVRLGLILTISLVLLFSVATSGAEKHPKLESALAELVTEHAKSATAFKSFSHARDIKVINDTITVFLLLDQNKTIADIDTAKLASYGVTIIKSHGNVIKAEVPINKLKIIAEAIPEVTFIKQPDRPHAEYYMSEGASLTNAAYHHSIGNNGANVKVGVIDLGFKSLNSAITNGELPTGITKIDCTGTSCISTAFSFETEPHGTAVAEIVYDMAPSAQLYLIKVADPMDLVDAKNYCIANGIKIINHSVGWFNTNFYDGACYNSNPVCTVNDAYTNGITWINAMGNNAKQHYSAIYSDIDGNGVHDVNSDDCIDIYAQAGSVMILTLTWNAWPVTNQDYDMYLYRDTNGALVAQSENNQNGSQPPTEAISYTVPVTGWYCLQIEKYSASINHRLKLQSVIHDLFPYVIAGSLLGPADATTAFAVGAIDYPNYLSGPIASYSSQGPTTDGRVKPEVSAPADVSTYAYSPNPFDGTSAAAPHVAGAAALILSANPTYTVDQLWDNLLYNTTDMGSYGQDNIYGLGRLDLMNDIKAPAAPISLTTTPSTWTNINSFSINWTNPADPSGIVAAYYKRGSAPTWDYAGVRTTSKPFVVSASVEGSQPLYVWLEDASDNINFRNNASTTLYYDGTAPSYSWNAPASGTFYKNGNPISIDATITDTGGSSITNGTNCNAKIGNATSSFTGSVIYSTVTGKCTGLLTLGNPSGLSDGSRNLTLQVADVAGNSAASTARSINIDNTAPSTTDNSTSAWTSTSPVTVTLSPSDGSGSGVASTKYCIDTTNSCIPATVGTSASVSCSAGADCAQYVRYSSTDNKGNVETTKSSSQVRQDRKVPTGSVTINSNAASTTTTSVTLTLAATDTGGGISQMCISDSTACTAWEAYATSKGWTLPSGDGTKTVYALFKDSVGNVSTQVFDIILLDTTSTITPPTAPSSLTATAISSSGIVLGWRDRSTNETGFKIERKSGVCASTNSWTEIAGVGANVITHTNTALSANTSYSYRIMALNANGESAYSNCASVTTGLTGTPNSPTNLKATSISANNINLAWADNSTDETSFKVFRRIGTGSWSLLVTKAANALSHSDATAPGNTSTTTYFYYIQACNAAGCSPATNVSVVPYSPTTLTATPISSTQINLAWMDTSTNEKGFQIYRKTGTCTSTATWSLIATKAANATSHSNTGLISGTIYSYRTRSFARSAAMPYAFGYSQWSNCISTTTP